MIKRYQILKESILRLIQNSGLDIGAAYFIIKDIFCDVEKAYYAQLNKECLEEAEKINNEDNEKVNENQNNETNS